MHLAPEPPASRGPVAWLMVAVAAAVAGLLWFATVEAPAGDFSPWDAPNVELTR